MLNKKRYYNGELETYSEKMVDLRIHWLKELEKFFKVNLDEKTVNELLGREFLAKMRGAKIESLKNTPCSNAFRHYFEFKTGVRISKIF